MIVPVPTTQVGCVIVMTGVAGVGGCALIVAIETGEVHPVAFLQVTL